MIVITQIASTPIITCESPMIISCAINVQKDTLGMSFIGNYARALKNEILSLRAGDMVKVEGKVVNNVLLVSGITMQGKMIGRNIDVCA
jgi:hypothetical protein